MAKLFDNRLGAGVLVADERVNELIGSGDYSFLQGPPVFVQDEGGTLYTVPPENAREALETGYTYAPEEVVREAKLKKEIEETPWTTAGYGLARSLTFGLSDFFRPGASQQELRLRREIQPLITAGAEIGGLISPMGLTGLAARGMAKGSANVIRGISSAMAKTKGLKTAGSVLNSRVVRGAVGGAAEGGIVGTMYGVSGQLLDNPENYDLFADHMYAGAKFGAVAGGVISVIGSALKGIGGKFKKETYRSYFKALDPKIKDVNDVTRNKAFPQNVFRLGKRIKEMDDKGTLKNLNDPEALHEETTFLINVYAGKLDDLKTQAETAVKKSGQSVEDVQFNPNKVADRMMAEIVDNPKGLGRGMVQDPKMVSKQERAVASIEAFRNLGKSKTGIPHKTLSFRESEAHKSWYQKHLANYKKNPEDADYFNEMARIIKEESESALDALSAKLSNVKGFNQQIYAEFLEAKSIYGTLKQIQSIAANAFAREVVNARLPLTSYIVGGSLAGGTLGGVLGGDSESILTGGLGAAGIFFGTAMARKLLRDSGDLLIARTLGRITDWGDRLNNANISQAAIQTAVNTLVRGGAATTIKIANPLPKSPKATVERYKELKKDIEEIQTSPETLYTRLENMLPEVEGDQTINRELAQTMANIVGFLQEKLPENTSTSQLLFNNDQVPPMNQILKFMRYVDILDSPNKVLQLVAAGQLMPEHMEALKTVFPRLHQAHIEAILEGLTEKGLPLKLNQAQRQSLSRFLGTAASRMFSTEFTKRTQGAYSEARQQQTQGKKGPNLKMPNLNTPTVAAMNL